MSQFEFSIFSVSLFFVFSLCTTRIASPVFADGVRAMWDGFQRNFYFQYGGMANPSQQAQGLLAQLPSGVILEGMLRFVGKAERTGEARGW